MNPFTMNTWSPYVVGALIGLLNLAALWWTDNVLGTSTSYAKLSGMIAKLVNKKSVEQNPFFQSITVKVDWGFMLVIGIVAGAFVSAQISGSFSWTPVPALWASTISDRLYIRLIIALFGGFLLGFGARWAGGCTSGHGISGVSQLSIHSIVAAICFFIGGILSAALIYG